MPAKPHRKLPELTKQDIERFWSKVDKTPGQGPTKECWTWIGENIEGYGRMCLSTTGKSHWRANRIAYFLQRGQDPRDLCVCHECDFPPCVRGEHLFTGTRADNRADCVAKGRVAKGATHWSKKYPDKILRGAKHSRTVLSDEEVRTIRAGFKGVRGEQHRLAIRYGVSKALISHIILRKQRQSI